jgi:hypothetical protein
MPETVMTKEQLADFEHVLASGIPQAGSSGHRHGPARRVRGDRQLHHRLSLLACRSRNVSGFVLGAVFNDRGAFAMNAPNALP